MIQPRSNLREGIQNSHRWRRGDLEVHTRTDWLTRSRVITVHISLFSNWVPREAIKTCEIYTQPWTESKSPIANEPSQRWTRNPNQNIFLFLERCGFYFSSPPAPPCPAPSHPWEQLWGGMKYWNQTEGIKLEINGREPNTGLELKQILAVIEFGPFQCASEWRNLHSQMHG